MERTGLERDSQCRRGDIQRVKQEDDEMTTGITPTTPVAGLPGGQPGAPGATTPGAAAPATGLQLGAANTTAFLNSLFDRQISLQNTALGDQTKSMSSVFNDLGRLSQARQQRLKDIYIAIAADAQATGSYNQLALQRVQRETTIEEQSSTLMRSVFDKLNNAVQAWVQR
jgi:hypothetical protein